MWNFRVVTKREGIGQVFGIAEIHYNDEGVPDMFNIPNTLMGWKSFGDLKIIYLAVSEAFNKPIIDLDNFPAEWQTTE